MPMPVFRGGESGVKVRTQVRPNGEPNVYEMHLGIKDVAAFFIALLSILLSIGAAWVNMNSHVTAVEIKVDGIKDDVKHVQDTNDRQEEHIIRNTEWIDMERAKAARTP